MFPFYFPYHRCTAPMTEFDVRERLLEIMKPTPDDWRMLTVVSDLVFVDSDAKAKPVKSAREAKWDKA